jgi:transposase
MERSPYGGTAYAFRNRRGTRIKLLQWDGTGVWLSQRRLHRGGFVWSGVDERLFSLSQAQWQWLISGVDSIGSGWLICHTTTERVTSQVVIEDFDCLLEQNRQSP